MYTVKSVALPLPIKRLFPPLLIGLSLPRYPAGESGSHAEAAFGDGHRAAASARFQFAPERVLRRGGRPWHHEQPAGRDQRGQIGEAAGLL